MLTGTCEAVPLLLLLLLLAATNSGAAVAPVDFAVSSALSSSMVLQRAPAKARLWGTGVPGAAVAVTGAVATVEVGVDGRWSLLLPPQPAGPVFGTGTLVLLSQGSNVTLTDVHMGEVWLCTGQSNMGLPLGGIGAGSNGHGRLVSWSGLVSWGEQELNLTSQYPFVRVTTQAVPIQNLSCSSYHARQRCTRDTPMEDAQASKWRVPSRANMYGFSAVCWMYGRRLADHLRDEESKVVAVGLVQIAVGGTAVELWSSRSALSKCDQNRSRYMAPCQDPNRSTMFHETTYTNSTLYNSMLHPWTPLAARGAIWYQGESNVACNVNWAYMQGKNCAMSDEECARYYRCQFPAFVQDIQARFAQPWVSSHAGGFSFLFVQLPSYVEDLPSTVYGGHNDSSLPMLRLAQAAAVALPRVGMASLIDHGYIEGHYGSIHPMDKSPVAQRLLLSARQIAYNQSDVLSSGPQLRRVTLLPNRTLRVEFDTKTMSSRGLMLRTEGQVRQTCAVGRVQTRAIHVMPTTPVPSSQCGALSGFELRVGIDGKWIPLHMPQLSADRFSILLAATHELGRVDTRLVHLKLRYLWADWPVPTVYDAYSFDGLNAELPAPPFVSNVTVVA